MEYLFERISKSTLHHLVYLYKETFNAAADMVFFEQKFRTDYTGASYIGYIAFDDKKNPAAYYGVFPQIAEIYSKKVLCAQSGDTMTHPKHQGNGLFIKLAKLTYELAEKEGVKFVFGFPNNNSYPGFAKKLDWTFNEKINKIEIKVATLPLAKIAKKLPFLNPLYKFYCQLFIGKKVVDKTKFSNFKKDANSLDFTNEYLNYKQYFEHYYLAEKDWQIVFKIDGLLWIGLLDFKDEQQLLLITNKLKWLCFFLGIDKIIYLASPRNYTLNILSKIQKPVEHYSIGFLNFDKEIDASSMNYTSFDIDTF